MTDTDNDFDTDSGKAIDADAADTADAIEDAGVADEGAAYTKAISDDAAAKASDESQAHPS